jgi:hypothetical protein
VRELISETPEDKALKETYPSFKDRLSFEDFKKKFYSLKISDKWNFVRATSLYQHSYKCESCNPNIKMVLLCSCADALQLVGEECSLKNCMEFYGKYCPSEFRTPPIEYYADGKLPIATAPFDKAIRFIYKAFRCSYVHEGIQHLCEIPNGIEWHAFMDRIDDEKDIYVVDLLKISEWFGKITFESLFAMLEQ